jgi:Zn-dependent peptidase ImmA (M78 family)
MSNIESGKRAVKTDELARIAEVLGVSPLALLDEESLVARLPVSARMDAGGGGADSVIERLRGLAELHDVLAHDGLPGRPDVQGAPPVDVRRWKASAETLASWAIDRLGATAGTEDRFAALADAIEQKLRVDVVISDVAGLALAGAAITDPSFPVIFVRANQPRPRALFTLAHELAHVLALDGETFTIDEDLTARSDKERFANAFAATYLMPEREVRQYIDAAKGITPRALARMLVAFGVSFESLVYRLHNLGAINYRGRNELQATGIRGVLTKVDDPDLARILLARLGERGGVETRPPTWLALRALMGYQQGIVSARPLASLLDEDADELLTELELQFPYRSPELPPDPAGEVASEEERYSGSPV